MDLARPVPRRTFIADLGRGAFAIAVLGIAGCAPSNTAAPSRAAASASATSPAGSASPSAGATATGPTASAGASGATRWARVNLGFVSAYVLVHGGEAAVVDTGVAGSADAIEASLASVGLDWPNVGHVIFTHNHPDHAGSAAEVLTRASDATGYAGAEDMPGITTPRALTPVQDDDTVFDLRIVTAPGHTPGSIAVLDASAGGILVAGDAMGTDGGAPILPGAQFTADMDEATRSIAKLGALTFETLLVGHGEPIETGAAALVKELGASQ